jgi:hypothetical protein
MYYGGFSYTEVMHLPLAYRTFFIKRILKEINQSSEQGQTQSRATHMNTPDVRSMQNRSRSQVPAKLRRFT